MDNPDLGKILETLSSLRSIPDLASSFLKTIINCEKVLVYQSQKQLDPKDYDNLANMHIFYPDYIDQIQDLIEVLPVTQNDEINAENAKDKFKQANQQLECLTKMIQDFSEQLSED